VTTPVGDEPAQFAEFARATVKAVPRYRRRSGARGIVCHFSSLLEFST
jgi:hypothetical protein